MESKGSYGQIHWQVGYKCLDDQFGLHYYMFGSSNTKLSGNWVPFCVDWNLSSIYVLRLSKTYSWHLVCHMANWALKRSGKHNFNG
jgi:hypothetical protein